MLFLPNSLHRTSNANTVHIQWSREKNIPIQDQEIKLFNNLIFAKRFKEGGSAVLQALNLNHQKDIVGIQLNIPRLTNNLRLPKRS
jgi:hypothetical protein